LSVSSRSSEITLIAIGTSPTFSTRFWAVATTRSSSTASERDGFSSAASSPAACAAATPDMPSTQARANAERLRLVRITISPSGLFRKPDRLPRGGQQAPEIAAQHQPDVFVGVAAPDHRLGQVVDLARVVEAVGVDLLAEAVARLVRAAQHRVLLRWHVVVAVEVGVGADADVLDPGQPRH